MTSERFWMMMLWFATSALICGNGIKHVRDGHPYFAGFDFGIWIYEILYFGKYFLRDFGG